MPKEMPQQFFHKVILFKIAQNIINVLGYFNKQICCQDLSKITQSGHTGANGWRDVSMDM